MNKPAKVCIERRCGVKNDDRRVSGIKGNESQGRGEFLGYDAMCGCNAQMKCYWGGGMALAWQKAETGYLRWHVASTRSRSA